MKLQIALEYMVIVAFVVLVFVILFGVISGQRTLVSNQQLFAHLQLVAQDIAVQITQTAQSPNGYATTFELPQSGSLEFYNISVTTGGIVIITEQLATQNIIATGYSSVPLGISSNASFLKAGTQRTYSIPFKNGSVTLENVNGVVCIDYSCANTTSSASGIRLSAVPTHAAYFNGNTSAIILPSNVPYYNGVTLAAWIDPQNCAPAFAGPCATGGATQHEVYGVFGVANALAAYQVYMYAYSGALTSHNICIDWFSGGSDHFGGCSANRGATNEPTVTFDQWNFIAVTKTTGGAVQVYVNGIPEVMGGGSSLGATSASSNGVVGGCDVNSALCANTVATSLFAGSISNVQYYNATLTGNQILQLYQEGISGQPVIPANVVGWWPLNQNLQDYSGNGYTGTAQNAIAYPGVVSAVATVTSAGGVPASNVLVGFDSEVGRFALNGSNTSAGTASVYSSGNGIAVAGISSSLNTQYSSIDGYTQVSAIAFNGNWTAQNSLTAWWPLETGLGTETGNYIHDLGPNDVVGVGTPYSGGSYLSAGRSQYPISWSSPAFVASTNGDGSITIPASQAYPTPTSITESAWVNFNNITIATNSPVIAPYSAHNTLPSLFLEQGCGCPAFAISQAGGVIKAVTSQSQLVPGDWYLLTGIYNYSTSNITIYIDGAPVNTLHVPQLHQAEEGDGFDIGYSQAQGVYSNMKVADVQIYGNALTTSQVGGLYSEGLAGAPMAGATVLGWWQLDGDFNDHSSNINNGAGVGSVTFADTGVGAEYINSTALYPALFNGFNSIVALQYNKLIYPSFPLTATAWFKTTSNGIILWNGNGAQPNAIAGRLFSPIIYVTSNGYLAGGNWNGASVPFSTNAFVADNQWQFVAVTQNDTVQSMYLDGQLLAKSPGTGQIVFPYNWSIGGGYANTIWPGLGIGIDYFNGIISNVQFYNTSLTAPQISSLYTQGVEGIPLENTGLQGWWPLEGTTNDSSRYNDTGISTGVTYVAVNSTEENLLNSLGKFGVAFSANTNLVYAQGPFPGSQRSTTVDLWVNPNGRNAGYFFDYPGTTTLAGYISSGDACFSTTPGISVCSSVPAQLRTWTNVVFSYNTIGTYSLYINGVDISTGTNAGGSFGGGGVYIGGACIGLSCHVFNGSVADVQLYNKGLNQSQVSQLYSNPPPYASSTQTLGDLP